MKNLLLIGCSLVLLLSLSACDDRKVDTTQVKKEMQQREIKRVMPGEIMAFAEARARQIIDSLRSELATAEAPFDSTNNMTRNLRTTTWANKEFNADIRLYEAIDEAHREVEEDIYEAYEYNVLNNLPLEGNVQASPNGDIYYYTLAFVHIDQLKMWSIRMPRKDLVMAMTEEE